MFTYFIDIYNFLKSTMIKNNYNLLSHHQINEEKFFKSIAFQVANCWFALPIEAIIKIISCPPLHEPIKNCLSLVEWEKKTITVIDLSQKIAFKSNNELINYNQKIAHSFLILIQTKSAELCGFLTNNDPTLINIPIANICSLPTSYRQVADLGIISKMAILNQPQTTQTLKILLLGEWNQID